jgi:hypothetical protein
MTNFLYPKRKLIFIHIHKTAGSSIRKALGRKMDRAGGVIPAEWPDYTRFAVVREPVSRFVSTINMFRFGREDFVDFFATGHFPELTPGEALDILEDQSVPFDRRVRDPISTLKHHLLQQTHPYNCLHKAQEVLRFENLAEDLSAFCGRHGIEISLRKLGASRRPENALVAEDLTSEELNRIWALYRNDFIQLGYPPPRGAVDMGESLIEVPSDPWPMLQFHLTGEAVSARDALPDPACDLRPFMSTIVTAQPGASWAGRKADLTEHFRHLEPEFHGRPRLAHLLACVIVVLRRDPANASAKKLFERIVNEFGHELPARLNLRWLTSVCDTFVDIADNPLDRTAALAGTLLANTIKLSETERLLFHPPQPATPLYRFSRGGALFDGVITFWVGKGDMISNLLSRAAAALEDAGAAAPFTGEIIARVIEQATVWQRMLKLQGSTGPEMAPPELTESLRKLLSQRENGA